MLREVDQAPEKNGAALLTIIASCPSVHLDIVTLVGDRREMQYNGDDGSGIKSE